jgi:hypothetical protein
LADDYTKSFQYGDAAQADDDLLTHFSSQLARIIHEGQCGLSFVGEGG